MVIVSIIIAVLVLGLLVSLILYLEKGYKNRIYINTVTKDRYRILNMCTIITDSGTIDGVIYQKEVTDCSGYYVMAHNKFISKYMKLSNYEEYARDIKA